MALSIKLREIHFDLPVLSTKKENEIPEERLLISDQEMVIIRRGLKQLSDVKNGKKIDIETWNFE